MDNMNIDQVKELAGSLISGRRKPDVGQGWAQSFEATFVFLDRLGLKDKLNELQVIHVAGTKGKGSTCAFAESILRTAGYRTALYTSPHLVNINERFRLNGIPISDEKFCRYFSVVWNRLKETATPDIGMPSFFRFLTLLGFYIFLEEKVDVAVIEVGLGGRLDSTNVLQNPVVCGVSSLGYDHTELLGDTLDLIAKEKAGIMKAGVPMFTIEQEPEAIEALYEVAKEKNVELQVSKKMEEYSLPENEKISLGIYGIHQQLNARLAIELCHSFQNRTRKLYSYPDILVNNELSHICLEGLRSCKWPGRSQIEADNLAEGGEENVTFYLDGAHTEESMLCCSRWFKKVTRAEEAMDESSERWILFNCMQERSPSKLFRPIHASGLTFHRSIFPPFLSSTSHLNKVNESDLRWENSLKVKWDELFNRGAKQHGVNRSIERTTASSSLKVALQQVRTYARNNKSKHIHVLVAGSLYLVADVLRLLKRAP